MIFFLSITGCSYILSNIEWLTAQINIITLNSINPLNGCGEFPIMLFLVFLVSGSSRIIEYKLTSVWNRNLKKEKDHLIVKTLIN